MKKAIFLFDVTGFMALPWAEAGWQCYCIDGQHPKGATSGIHKNIINIGVWFDFDHKKSNLENIKKIHGFTGCCYNDETFIFGFPECTHLAVSGAAHFANKRHADPFFQDDAMKLVRLVKDFADSMNCSRWALENPVSVISSKWRKPDYKFHPYEYGGYLPDDDVHPTYPEYIKPQDAYPKKTCIWAGNGFVMPEKKPVDVSPGFSDQHKKLGGKSLKTKNIRSATPRGFAQAVFEANNNQ